MWIVWRSNLPIRLAAGLRGHRRPGGAFRLLEEDR